MSAYARHRKARGFSGKSHVAVKKAVDSGRITLEPDGSIDFAKADREWEANTRKRGHAPEPSPAAFSALAAEPGDGGVALDLDTPPPAVVDGKHWQNLTPAELNKRKSYYGAEAMRIEMARSAGELVEARAVLTAVQTHSRALRDALLAVANRLRQPLAAESDPHQVEQTIRREISQALDGFARTDLGIAAPETQHAA